MHKPSRFLFLFLVLILLLDAPACSPGMASLFASPTPSITPGPSQTPTLTVGPTRTPQPWGSFAPPSLPLVTALPSQSDAFAIPEGARTLLLVGTDRPYPYTGRTDALLLVIYNPSTSLAAFISLPPDMLVYIPGLSMQRLQNAYPYGGITALLDTLEYNLGIRPQDYAVIPLDAFTYVVNELGGLWLTIPNAMPQTCGGIASGFTRLDAQQVLCYVRFRSGEDEIDREQRQQAVFQALFRRLVEGGNLTLLTHFYETYQDRIETSFSLASLFGWLPLVLRLGDVDRLGFFLPSETELTLWQFPGENPSSVFIPDPAGWHALLARAVDFTNNQLPLTGRELTLAYELTTSPTATVTPTPTQTFTITLTRIRTVTRTRTLTVTRTPTVTQSVTVTVTPTTTNTETQTQTATIGP